MITRGGLDWTDRFDAVAKALRGLPVRRALLDGEVAVVLEDGSTSFQALQNQRRAGDDSAVAYFVFDLLHADGFDLTQVPIERRKEALSALLEGGGAGPVVRYSDHLEGEGTRFHAEVCRRGLEGIVSKRRGSAYVSGRSGSWLKTKCSTRQEFVIGGYTEPQGSREGLGALLVGTHENGDGMTTARKRVPPPRRRPPDTPTRRPPPVKEPNPKPPVTDPPVRPRKRPIREPLDSIAALDGLEITNPERVLYPEQGITKLDLARYYHAVAPLLLAHAAGRPLMFLRCPGGRAQCFFQKHPGRSVPPALGTVRIRERNGTDTYLFLRDEAGLLSLAQMGVLEIHVWGARADALERPDRMVFDFDPHEETPWKDVVLGARRIRDLLEGLGLESFVKTTGGKGLHVVVPTRPGPSWDDVKELSGALASAMVREDPDRFTTHLAKARRRGRIFIDTLRNRRGATWVAAWSPRARSGAPVSTPLRWEELKPSLRPDAFHVARILEQRKAPRTDAWADLEKSRQRITRTMVRSGGSAGLEL